MFTKSLSIALLAFVAAAAQANLIQNGSFENADLPGRGWDQFNAIPGWTATTGHVEIGQAGVYGVTGQDGANVLELDADGNSSVTQTLSLSAVSHTLSFLYAKRANTTDETNRFEVLWNGAVIDTLTPSSTEFTLKSYNVMGMTGANTLAFRATGTSDSLGGMVDNVRLQAVPSPSPLIACVVGGMGMLRRRRKA